MMSLRTLYHSIVQIALWGVLLPLTGCAGNQVLLGKNDDKTRVPIPSPPVVTDHESWYPAAGFTIWLVLITALAGFWWWSGRRSHSSE